MAEHARVLDRYPATPDEYAALAPDDRAEYVDGWVVMAPSPSERHQLAAIELTVALRGAVGPGWRVNAGWSWVVGGNEFIPDVMVYRPVEGDRPRYTGTPVLAVEVLSTNRADDYVTKAAKYAAAGVEHYWIVDPDARTVDVLALTEGAYRLVTTVTGDQPFLADFTAGRLSLDVQALLG